tara:strand:- start:412 stop:1422 length:1011 start_codon:yes stop_codon:yes gene_type:complete
MKKINFNKLDKTFIVAEIGVNHEGNFDLACDMIKRASECKVDAVKFQTFKTENYISSTQIERKRRIKSFELSYEQFKELKKIADKNDVIFFSTPLHITDIDLLVDISDIIKISSGDLTYHELIDYAAKTNKAIIISTGLGTINEISDAVKVIKKRRPNIVEDGNLAILHCVASYPTPIEQTNLNNIRFLIDKFKCPVGYSDHTVDLKTCELAVASGAKIIEKHFTYRKENQDFHDHAISADPTEMKSLVENIRKVELICGKYQRNRVESEKKFYNHIRRSFAVNRKKNKGEIINNKDLILLRPALGFSPDLKKKILGRKLKKELKEGSIIFEKDLD